MVQVPRRGLDVGAGWLIVERLSRSLIACLGWFAGPRGAAYPGKDMDIPPDLLDRLRAWSYRHQRLGRAAADPLHALRDVVGVYSSHPSAPLSVLARCSSLTPGPFTEMETRREVVRLPAMRGSIHLLPTDTASRIFAATRPPLATFLPRLRYVGVEPEEYERLKPRILERVTEPMTPADLQAAFRMDARLLTVLRLMSYEGLTVRVSDSLRTDALRYVGTAAWLSAPLAEPDPEASLAWLAEAYLRGYGPARVKDFAWWSGTTVGRARTALASVETIDVGGGLLLPADLRATFERADPLEPDTLDLLPKWDAYTMGYAPDGRARFVDGAHLPLAYSHSETKGRAGATSGDGLPLLLRGGRAVAAWSHRFERTTLRVTLTPFGPDLPPPAQSERALEGIAALLGATGADFTTEARR